MNSNTIEGVHYVQLDDAVLDVVRAYSCSKPHHIAPHLPDVRRDEIWTALRRLNERGLLTLGLRALGLDAPPEVPVVMITRDGVLTLRKIRARWGRNQRKWETAQQAAATPAPDSPSAA